jgi:hypothetical protein
MPRAPRKPKTKQTTIESYEHTKDQRLNNPPMVLAARTKTDLQRERGTHYETD